LIIKALKLTNNQTVIDLGAGDGRVVFEAAKKALQQRLNTKFIAVEINPILILVLHIKQLFNPNKDSVFIVWTNFFKFQIKDQIFLRLRSGQAKISSKTKYTVYFYGSPKLIERIIKNVRKQILNVNFVSYFYPINSLKKIQMVQKGVNSIFSYQV